MNNENKKEKLNRMLAKCPDVLTPMKAVKWLPIGKNTLYTAIRNEEIESYVYKGVYLITKDAIIDYLIKTSNDIKKSHIFVARKKK